MGHADISQTMNQYTHAIPANDRAAADLIGTIASTPPDEDSGQAASKSNKKGKKSA